MADPRIGGLNQLRELDQITSQKTINSLTKDKTSEISFGETLNKYVNEANDMQVKADNDVQRIIAGEEIDAHEVMTAVEKASMSFEMVMEIRNKMLEAYREVMKTPM